MKFVPQYDDQVYVVGPTRTQHMNPALYATVLSAHQLADQLADLKPVVVMGSPIPAALGSHFFFLNLVPYLRFPSGYTESAGSIQKFWDRVPEPEGLALRYCLAQIASDEAEWLKAKEAADAA